jgi:hypothetical protein
VQEKKAMAGIITPNVGMIYRHFQTVRIKAGRSNVSNKISIGKQKFFRLGQTRPQEVQIKSSDWDNKIQ